MCVLDVYCLLGISYYPNQFNGHRMNVSVYALPSVCVCLLVRTETMIWIDDSFRESKTRTLHAAPKPPQLNPETRKLGVKNRKKQKRWTAIDTNQWESIQISKQKKKRRTTQTRERRNDGKDNSTLRVKQITKNKKQKKTKNVNNFQLLSHQWIQKRSTSCLWCIEHVFSTRTRTYLDFLVLTASLPPFSFGSIHPNSLTVASIHSQTRQGQKGRRYTMRREDTRDGCRSVLYCMSFCISLLLTLSISFSMFLRMYVVCVWTYCVVRLSVWMSIFLYVFLSSTNHLFVPIFMCGLDHQTTYRIIKKEGEKGWKTKTKNTLLKNLPVYRFVPHLWR